MGRLSGRWSGIVIAVLVVGGLALYAGTAGPKPAPATGSNQPLLTQTQSTSQAAASPMPGMDAKGVVSLVVKLGIVALVMGGSLWVLKRFAGRGPSGSGRTGAISIADTIPLAQGRAVYVLDVGDRALVVGATAQQLSLLAELTDEGLLEKLRAPARTTPMPSFSDVTQRFTAAVQGLSARPPSVSRAPIERAPSQPGERTLSERWVAREPATPSFADTLAARDGYEPAAPRSAEMERVEESSERLRALAARLRDARDSA